jgi:hypothetical protein
MVFVSNFNVLSHKRNVVAFYTKKNYTVEING